MTVALPRDEPTQRAQRLSGMGPLEALTQRGVLQTRNPEAMGFAWSERWRALRAGKASVEKLLAFLRRERRKGTFIWADHPDEPGMGRASNGVGEENLIRDAAMDTDSDGDGVVDGFQVGQGPGGWTPSLDTATSPNSQRFDHGGGGGGSSVRLQQYVLRVFPGDELTVSAEYQISGPCRGFLQINWLDSAGGSLGFVGTSSITDTSFTRHAETHTAPDDAVLAKAWIGFDSDDVNTVATGWVRLSRLLRASSDPATYANPHVDGGSQTGDTLNTAGWPASTSNVLRAGDKIRLGGSGSTKANAETDEMIRAFEVASDADSDSTGAATIEIDPPILSGNTPPDGAALRLNKVRTRALIRDYTMPEARPGDILANVDVTLREAI